MPENKPHKNIVLDEYLSAFKKQKLKSANVIEISQGIRCLEKYKFVVLGANNMNTV